MSTTGRKEKKRSSNIPILSLIFEGEKIKSGNIRLRSHWAALHRENKRVRETMGFLLMSLVGQKSAYLNSPKKRMILITSYRRRTLDMDNLIAGAKPWIDALRTYRIIWDDSPKYLQAAYVQKLVTSGYAVKIEVWEGFQK